MNLTVALAKMQEINALDEHGRYGRLAREAIEALTHALPIWDMYSNRSYPPVEERAAEIYAGFEYDGPGSKPDWVPGGNSLMQDRARHFARQELIAAGHVPDPSIARS